ncbi:MAG: ribosomal-protein-alanine N-acetyltransferase, partial [Sphingobacteriales bacterium]
EHLDQFGDERHAIEKCMNYALGKENKPGGYVLTAEEDDKLLGAVIVNKTGMDGYIPENILVYIAVHADARGKGVGKSLMNLVEETVDGDIALHCEPDNPAKHLYEKVGFTSKYLEMRLHR